MSTDPQSLALAIQKIRDSRDHIICANGEDVDAIQRENPLKNVVKITFVTSEYKLLPPDA